MTEHRRNIMVTACLEANAYYNGMAYKNKKGQVTTMETVIAEAYLMRVETITRGE